jgi:hypothetical protein
MSSFVKRFKPGRFIWTVLVTIYFLFFFTNFFRDAIPDRMTLPVLFAYVFVLWLSVEYYFGSPFFQSGVVEHSAFWRGIFAFFVYPFLAYVAADFIWWHWTQIPTPVAVTGFLGLAVFGIGTYLRLGTLFGLLGIAQVKPPARGSKEETWPHSSSSSGPRSCSVPGAGFCSRSSSACRCCWFRPGTRTHICATCSRTNSRPTPRPFPHSGPVSASSTPVREESTDYADSGLLSVVLHSTPGSLDHLNTQRLFSLPAAICQLLTGRSRTSTALDLT